MSSSSSNKEEAEEIVIEPPSRSSEQDTTKKLKLAGLISVLALLLTIIFLLFGLATYGLLSNQVDADSSIFWDDPQTDERDLLSTALNNGDTSSPLSHSYQTWLQAGGHPESVLSAPPSLLFHGSFPLAQTRRTLSISHEGKNQLVYSFLLWGGTKLLALSKQKRKSTEEPVANWFQTFARKLVGKRVRCCGEISMGLPEMKRQQDEKEKQVENEEEERQSVLVAFEFWILDVLANVAVKAVELILQPKLFSKEETTLQQEHLDAVFPMADDQSKQGFFSFKNLDVFIYY